MDNFTVNSKLKTFRYSLLMRLCFFLMLSLFSPHVFAQLDYIHYVPPLYNGSSNSGDIGKHVAVITTNSETLIGVDIFNGTSTAALTTIQVSKSKPYRYVFKTGNNYTTGSISSPTNYDFPLGVIGPKKLNKPLSTDGLKFRSYDSPIYVNIRHVSGAQGGSLTTKGRFAMGKEFRSGHIHTAYFEKAKSRRSHFLSIMATEDNTHVNISDLKTGILTVYRDNNVTSFNVSDSKALPVVTLDKGQSYVIGFDLDLPAIDNNKLNDMNGTHIVADKDIVVNTGSWTSGPDRGQDMGIDQIVPYDQIRDQYVVMKGEGDRRTERPIVVATVDDTYIYLNGSDTPINFGDPLFAGQYLSIPTDYYQDPEGKKISTMFIDTKDKNVYVYQTMSGSSVQIGPTVGMNFIAPLSATGMHQVDVPFSGQLAEKEVNSVITILAQNGANITYTKDGGSTISLNESNATSIPGNLEWKSYRLKNVRGHLQFQSEKAINLAWTVQSGIIGSAGYYSGFSKAIPIIVTDLNVSYDTDLSVVCESYNENIEVGIVATPKPSFVEWYENEIKEENLIPTETKGKLIVPAPDVDTKYIVKAYFKDPSLNINTNANFNAGQVVFATDFNLSEGNMQNPGTYGISTTPKVENTSFIDVLAEEGREKLLIVYSDGKGKSIYKKEEMQIDRNTNYIVSVVGKMVKENMPQLVDIYINDERIKSNFLMNKAGEWQTVSALWKSKGNQKASIKLVDANASGVSGVFALDTVAFALAAEEEGVFNALVVPSYNAIAHDKAEHFCKGSRGNINISDKNLAWFNYKWERKTGENTYVEIAESNVTGKDSHDLIFENVTDANVGIYCCTITFNEDFKKCGEIDAPAKLDVEVVVDEPASLKPLKGNVNLCAGLSTEISATVGGKYSLIEWSIYRKNDDTPIQTKNGITNTFIFNSELDLPSGIYTLKCEVLNGCSELIEELDIVVREKALLSSLIVPTNLCNQTEIKLGATINSKPDGAKIQYDWYKNIESDPFGTTHIPNLNLIPNLDDAYYRVAVSTQYDIGDGKMFTCKGNELQQSLSENPIHPGIVMPAFGPVTVCEGTTYTYNLVLDLPSDTYQYNWAVPVGAQNGKISGDYTSNSFSINSIASDKVGEYTITVSNNCGSQSSTSMLSMTPKLKNVDISVNKEGPYCSSDNLIVSITDNGESKLYAATNKTNPRVISPLVVPWILPVNTNQGQWEISAVGNCGTTVKEIIPVNILANFSEASLSNITTCLGKDVNFEVRIAHVPTGSELTYTWTDPAGNSIVIPISDPQDILPILNVQAENVGVYTCVISNNCDYSETVRANLAIENVTTELTIDSPIEVCVGESNYQFDITYEGTPTFEWRFKDREGAIIGELDHYIIPVISKTNEGIYYCNVRLACGNVERYERELIVNEHVSILADPSVNLNICEGEQTEFIVNVTGSPNLIKWFDNIGIELVEHRGKTRISTGVLNTPGIFNYTCRLDGDCEDPEVRFVVIVHDKPSITLSDINSCEGDITLEMTVTGTDYSDPLWLKPDKTLLGNGLSTTITGATYAASLGNYTAEISTDFCGNNITSTAKVNVFEPIGILSKSELNLTPCIGEPLSLFVNGEGDCTYRWTKDGLDLGVQLIQNILNLESADLSDNGTYRCELISVNSCIGAAVDFEVNVRENAKMILQPLPKTACEDETLVIFQAVGTAVLTPSYQWYNNNELISDGFDFTGTETADLTVSNLLGHDNDLFHCVVSGDFCDSIKSTKVNLTVKRNITINNHPANFTADENTAAIFSISATGDAISYQWFEKTTATGASFVSLGNTPASAQTNTLNLTSVPLSRDGYMYKCVVIGTCLNSESHPATLQVNVDKRITSTVLNAEACVGGSFTFTVDYKGTTTACIWEYDDNNDGIYNAIGDLGTVVFGETSSTLTVRSATKAMETGSWKFRARVQRDAYADNVSNIAKVKVYEQIAFVNIPNATLCLNTGESFNVNITSGSGVFSYEWTRVMSGDILGSLSNLSLSDLESKDEEYKVKVSHSVCPNVEQKFTISHHPDLVFPDLAHTSPLCIGEPINLDATATSSAPNLKYQWTKDGVSDGTTATNLKSTVSIAESGLYKVVVTDHCTSKVSSIPINVLDPISLIAVSPANQNVCEGESLDLQAKGTGDYLLYNWYKIDALDGAIVGASLSSDEILHFDELSTIGANYYRCELSSTLACTADKQEFTVNVQEDLEVSTLSPITICEGLGSSEFVVTVTRGIPLSYQWYDNDEEMTGETAANLSVNNVLANNGHNYHCVVGGACKSAESNTALFTVNENVRITTQPVSVSVSDDAIDPVNFSIEATGTGLRYQWYRNGSDMGAYVSADTKILIIPHEDFNSGDLYFCRVQGNCLNVDSSPATLTISVTDKIVGQPHNIQICEGSSFNFIVKYKNTVASCVWEYDDGDSGFQLASSHIDMKISSSADAVGNELSILTVDPSTFSMDGWKFRAIIDDGVESSSVAEVKVLQKVVFDPIPDETLCVGEGKNFNLNIIAGTGTLTYEWKRTSSLDDKTFVANSSLNLNATDAIDGIYTIEVSNGVCTPTTSDHFTISHHPDLAFPDLAHTSPLCIGDSINLDATATSSAPNLKYQWTKDGVSDGTTATNLKSTVSIAESGLYKVVVTDHCTSKVSSIPINVLDPISLIAVSPANQNVCEGESLDLQAKGTGDYLLYNWYKIDALDGAIVGASLSSDEILHFDELSTIGANYYRCELSSTLACTADKQEFTVNVQEDLEVSTLSPITICEGLGSSEFVVTVTRGIPLSYQWYDNDEEMTGKTATNLSVNNVLANNGHNYHCVVGGACKSAESNKALFTVNENVIVSSHPIDQNIDEMGFARFRVDATGTGLSYQWYENGVIMDNVTHPSAQTKILSLNPVPLNKNGNTYYCKVTGACTVEDSKSTNLKVVKENRILVQSEPAVVCAGNPFSFEIQYKAAADDCVWQYSTGGDFVDLPLSIGKGVETNVDVNTKKNTLTVTTAKDAMNFWKFRAIVKRAGGYEDNISNEVRVKVDIPANFADILPVQLCNGKGISFNVSALTGSTPNTYDWKRELISIGTKASLNLLPLSATDGTYSVAVTAGVCDAVTKTFTISHYDDLVLDDLIHANRLCPSENINLKAIIKRGPAVSASYSWTKDDFNLDADEVLYSYPNVSSSESGLYKLKVQDKCMSQTKSIRIDVLDILTKVSVDWIDQSLCVGDNLLLEAEVTGDNPTYTWTVPDGSINPGNQAQLKINGVNRVNEGLYKCVVSGSCGPSLTYTANVNINGIPSITAGIDNLGSVCEGQNLELGPIVYEATRGERIVWKFNDAVKIANIPKSLNLAPVIVTDEGNYRVEVINACGSDFSLGFLDVHPIPTMADINDQTSCQGETVIFRAEATGENLSYRWFINDVSQPVFNNKKELKMLAVQALDENNSEVYKIECRLNSCDTDLSKIAHLTVNPNTKLQKSLKGGVVYVGDDYNFELNVTGNNFNFEWHHINIAGLDKKIDGAISQKLELNALTMADGGEYYCKIIGSCGTRFTSAYLTVKNPIKVVDGLNKLSRIEKCFGEPLNLNVTVDGEIFSIKWFKNDIDLKHDELNYTISSLDLIDAGSYRCEIDGEGAKIKETVNVSVYQTTILNSNLKDKTLCENESLSWNPDVSGSNLNYEWQHNGDVISSDKEMSYLKTTIDKAGSYILNVAGRCGDVTSEQNLKVKELPKIVLLSKDLEKCENDDEALFSLVCSGDNLIYQWQKDGVNIPDANGSILKIQNLKLDDAGAYKCIVSSSCGSAPESGSINLVVVPQLKIVSYTNTKDQICDGEDAQFMLEAKGNELNYQWQKDGIDIAGEKTPQLVLNSAGLSEEGYYSCSVSDKCTTKRSSNSKKLTVNALPNSQIFGRMTLCVLEDRVTYNTILKTDHNYGWLVDGGRFVTAAEGLKTRITWGDVITDGKVKLKIKNAVTGCYSEVDSLVKLRSLPDVKISALKTKGLCESEFELEGGFPAGGIYWVNGVAQNTFDPAEGNGDYKVRYSYTDDLGCSNSTSEYVMKIDSLPVVKIVDDFTVGSCETKMLNVKTDEANIKWAPSRFLDDVNSKTPLFSAGESTLYVATVTDEHGCEGNDIINIKVAALPIITTMKDTIIGECKEIELTTHVSGDVETIKWTNDGDLGNAKNSNPKLIKRRVGINDYRINVTDKYGCVATASVKVEVLPNPKIGDDAILCEGETMLVDIKDLANPIWSDGYKDLERTIDKPGEYELSVEQNDCKQIQNIVMNPLPKFKLDKTKLPGIVIFEGKSVLLDPELDSDYGPYNYTWSDGSVLPQLEVRESGVYKLSVEDNMGCTASDTVKVEVKPVGIEAPNAFTPSSSNDNDHFYLKDINVYEKFEMFIYNRWGELLYKTTEAGYSGGWDGTYKGENCRIGVYVWVLMLDGEMKGKGNITLIR